MQKLETYSHSQRHQNFVASSLIAALTLFVAGCRDKETSGFGGSTLMVDLGTEGNAQAQKQITAFQQQLGGGFVQDNGRKRIMVTGFNPFQGGSQNVSGDLVSHMEQQYSGGNVVRRQANGATISRGETKINGETVDVYYLRADTTYASPAMIQAAARTIQPDRALSFGQGGSTQIEHGASNRANTTVPGYQQDGSVSPLMNRSTRVDQVENALATTKPTWDPEQLKRDTNFPLSAGARPQNNYVCNATEYTMQQSMSGQPVQYLPNLKLDPIVRTPAVVSREAVGTREAAAPRDSRYAFIHVAPPPSGVDRNEYLSENSNRVMNAFAGSFEGSGSATRTPATGSAPTSPVSVPVAAPVTRSISATVSAPVSAPASAPIISSGPSAPSSNGTSLTGSEDQ